MMSKKILVVSQYFFPEQFRINDICNSWIERGYDVTVLTGIPNYPQGDFFEGYGFNKRRNENLNGINIIRIPIIPRKKSSMTMALNYLSFVISGWFWKLFNKENFDMVFIYEVSPMTQALPAVWIAKKLKIPCYIYVMDLWPENFEIITGISSPLVITPLNKMVDYIYKNCNKIFTASESFKKNIQSRGVDPEKVFFWPQYAEEFYHTRATKSKKIIVDDKINITFAGNVGMAQGLEILPIIGQRLKKENVNVRFNIVGSGRYLETLINEVTKNALQEYFNFLEPVPPTEISEIFSASDFSFVSLQKNEIFSMTIPAKLQSSMACGKPILLSASGESKDIVIKAECGYASDAGDVNHLIENIKKIVKLDKKQIEKLGNNSRNYFENNFEKEKLLDSMDSFLVEGM
ncbi:glycosyltransferase family 4 protein [Enterococcus gallinarum]|uniref:glycosyltransferase family 4 protein n=1 Tax=Enterococcus gallinarum TaxID=1353 RepID=UPI001C129046|nr:glycosyltransferase family 4 protein [Enterococcus gallinarum]